MELYQKFKAWSRGKQIGAGVVLVHFVCVLALVVHHWMAGHPPPRRMAVRTRQVASVVAQSVAPSAPKSVASPAAPSKAPAKKPAPAAAKPKAKTIQSTPSKPVKTEPLVVAPPVTKAVLAVPMLIEPSPTLEIQEAEPTYEELLIATFQNALDLPEIGEVRACLEIDRMGRLVSCIILETKSRKNGEFLKNRLPDLLFPCFNGADLQSFTVTFRNVETR